jgi:ankyrin repeat protein
MDSHSGVTQEIIHEFVGAAHGDFEKVKAYLEQIPALINANASWQETAIEAAAQMANVPIAEYLLAHGAPLDIFTASMLGMQKRVSEFLEADPALIAAKGVHGFPLLYFPAVGGHLEIAEMLLSKGADINAGAGGNTPLHAAVLAGRAEMVEWLLAHGADPGLKDYEGKTPLERGAASGNERLQEILERALQDR